MANDRIKDYSQRYDYKFSSDNMYEPLTFGNNSLYQLGRIHCHRHTVIPLHTQLNYIELTIATDGKATVITNGEGVEISAGDIYVSFAGDFHSIISNEISPLKYDFITVKTDDPQLNEAFEQIIADRHPSGSRVVRDDVICRLVSQAINEINDRDCFTDRIMESIINQILILLIRAFNTTKPRAVQSGADEAELLCFKLMNYIDNHIYTVKNLRELERITNYTYNYLSNLFKKVTGDTLSNYYQNRRFEAATHLLSSGQFTVSQVASMLGYSSIYSFSLAFKKKYGYPPNKLREQR